VVPFAALLWTATTGRGFDVIKTHNLTKKYGESFAIQAIELDLAAGDLFGFIGPNGAGKTTTMKILATLLDPTRTLAAIMIGTSCLPRAINHEAHEAHEDGADLSAACGGHAV